MIIYKIGSRGTGVKQIQSLLNKLGFNAGVIDGIYGSQTAEAVKKFQVFVKLLPTGIVDDSTYKFMKRYILGYEVHIITAGDTLNDIAKKYNTTVDAILTANPDINPNNLIIGSEVIVPYNIELVYTDIDYTYEIMEQNIEGLKVRYPFIKVGVAGKSVLGKNLYYIKLGQGPNKVFYNGTHHAIEWITSVLLMKFTENFSKAYAQGNDLDGYNVQDIWNKSTIYIIPMVNPDGVELVLNGLKKDNPYYNDLIKWNKGSTDFSKNWSANGRGVDLNHNYNASWEESKKAEEQYGVFGPGPTRYGGPYAESEPETKALVNFTRDNNFRLAIAYHSQGELIYWKYKDVTPPEAKGIGETFSKLSGYKLGETYGITSYAGYKDWFIKDFIKPGYTIEVGLGKNPLPISQFNKIYRDNIKVLLEAAII